MVDVMDSQQSTLSYAMLSYYQATHLLLRTRRLPFVTILCTVRLAGVVTSGLSIVVINLRLLFLLLLICLLSCIRDNS